MSIADHLGSTKAAPTGCVLVDLGENKEGFRSRVVYWRGGHWRLSWKREPRDFLQKGSLTPPALSIVVVPCDAKGEALEDAPKIEEELLAELQDQARTFAAWG